MDWIWWWKTDWFFSLLCRNAALKIPPINIEKSGENKEEARFYFNWK